MAEKIVKGKIPFFVFKEGNKFVAYSPALDLSTCGDTEKQARVRMAEASRILLDELMRMGTLEDVLTEFGWKKITSENAWSPPTYKQEFVEVPAGVH
ncbi:MAG: hypothetical protein HY529_01705 [Chloroflexi bacterium]|nr:hypothetical protein [Chloroflexota bacterium]